MAREIILNRYDVEAHDNLLARRVHTQIGVISNIIIIGIILLTVSFILMTFPAVRQIGISILASAGILGIVLGLAAQKTLGNVIAGIQIAISQPIRLDDVVVVENEWGWIEEITLTYVVVRIWDLRRLILPISYFMEKPFQNWTRISADILGSVFIYVDYTVPVGEVRTELERILKGSPYWDKKVKVLQVTNATERTVELRALMSAADSPTAWNLRCEVREKLIEFLQKEYPKSLPRTRIELDQKQA
ncbi:MAG: mechanosensitive ion channel domain-containing protein [Candidatus Omnitrophota bacterium]